MAAYRSRTNHPNAECRRNRSSPLIRVAADGAATLPHRRSSAPPPAECGRRGGGECASVMLGTPINRNKDLWAFSGAYERKDTRTHLLAELLRRLFQGLIIFNIQNHNEDRERTLLGRLRCQGGEVNAG